MIGHADDLAGRALVREGIEHLVEQHVGRRRIEVGFTIPCCGATYWVGEAIGSKDYEDLQQASEAVAKWKEMLASNAAHLARLLKRESYPGIEGGR